MSNLPKDYKPTCMDVALIIAELHDKGSQTAMEVTRAFNLENNCLLNWHLFSDALSEACERGFIRLVSHNADGMAQYRI